MSALRSIVCTRLNHPNLNIFIQRFVAYKSALSLENLYPNSSLKLTTPTKPLTSIHDKFSGYIPIDRLEITYSKSTGPGGQNVNKVNTKVDLRFNLESAEWLDVEIRKKLADSLKSRINKEGFVVFRSDLTRSQQLNLADCLEKLRSSISDVLYEKPKPTEETLEQIRRRREKATFERLTLKRDRSRTKSERGSPDVRDII